MYDALMPSSSPRRGARASFERVAFFFETLGLREVCAGLGGDGRAISSTYAGDSWPRGAACFGTGVDGHYRSSAVGRDWFDGRSRACSDYELP